MSFRQLASLACAAIQTFDLCIHSHDIELRLCHVTSIVVGEMDECIRERGPGGTDTSIIIPCFNALFMYRFALCCHSPSRRESDPLSLLQSICKTKPYLHIVLKQFGREWHIYDPPDL